MDAANLYNEDIYAWAEQQALVLRRLAVLNGLPNELDIEHVAAEIEDVGRSELREVKGLIRLILTHLVLLDLEQNGDAGRHWRGEIITWRSDLLDAITPAMRSKLDLDAIWHRALHDAKAKYALHNEAASDNVLSHLRWDSTRCPLTLDEICAETFTLS